MEYLDAFLKVFGDFSVSDIVTYCLAGYCIVKAYKSAKKDNDDKVIEQQQKLAAEAERNKKIEDAYAVTQKYSDYHNESIQIRDNLEKEIQELRDDFKTIITRLSEMEEHNKKRECSKLRDMLLQNYRYYTSETQNPSKSWTKMESEAFWELFREYEEAGGDGYMHTDVQPAMERLLVIDVGVH